MSKKINASLWIAQDDDNAINIYLSKPIKQYGVWYCINPKRDVYISEHECSKKLKEYINSLDKNNLRWEAIEIQDAELFSDYKRMVDILKKRC